MLTILYAFIGLLLARAAWVEVKYRAGNVNMRPLPWLLQVIGLCAILVAIVGCVGFAALFLLFRSH